MLPKYNDIIELVKKGSTIEAQEKILELRQAALDIQEENVALKERIRELEKQIAIEEKVVFERPHYWLIDGDSRDGPFCQKCQDTESKLVRLQDRSNDVWICKACGNQFYGTDYKKPVVRRKQSGFRPLA